MKLYQTRVLPQLTHLVMRQAQLRPYRERMVSAAHGQVLEVGIGSGLNLPLYPKKVERVIGVDTSPELLQRASQACNRSQFETDLIEGKIEELPLEDQSIDCVAMSWTLCSVTDPVQALAEIRRVLRPDGIFSFVEHGLAPERRVQRWQQWLTPAWRRCAGNCHLDRPTASLMGGNGFRFDWIETGYARGPKPMTFMYQGIARPL